MARVEETRPAHRSADRRRQSSRAPEYRRYLRLSALGTLIPGVGLVVAGRRRSGRVVLVVVVIGLVGVIAYVARAGASGLLDLGTDTRALRAIGIALVLIAAAWLLVALFGLRALEPAGLNGAQRLLAALVVVVVGSLVVGPLALAARNSFTQADLIESVFSEEGDRSLTIPGAAPDEDPWADLPRVNVLLLGSDAGPGREDARADTVMVASIDTRGGETTLFALPRNLQHLPFPEGPLREAYPDGFTGQPAAEYWLSSAYRNIPAEHPEIFEGIKDPGAEALKLGVGEALGLDVHYYVMVSLRGFDALVTALGGIDIDVPYRIPMGTKKSEITGRCTEETGWIEPGENKHLTGYEALWFARARCGPGKVSDDYERMRRQRCVIGAIAEKANPFGLATSFQQVAAATQDMVSTDIPERRVGAFAQLGLKVKDAGVRSLPFTDAIVDYDDPDYDEIRAYVADALDPAPSATAGSPTRVSPSPAPTGSAGSEPSDQPTTPSEAEGAQDLDAVC